MADMMKTRKRSEMDPKDTWDFTDLFLNDEAWEQELTTLNADKEVLAAYCGKLGNSAQNLMDYLTKMEQADCKAMLLSQYCMRKSDIDTRDSKYQAMVGRFMTAITALGAACSFETPEIMAIADDILDAFYEQCPGLERYRRYLTNIRRRKAHTLSPAEEKLLASAGELARAPQNIFSVLTNADLKFPDAIDSEGNAHPLTQGSYVAYQNSPDRALRKSAYENLFRTFGSFKNTSAATLNAQAKKLKFFSDARKYPDSMTAALDGTNVPTSVYTNLIEAVHQNMDKMHRYVRLRKKLMGLDELHMYDVYTPLVPGIAKYIPYEQAKEEVLESVAPLGEEYRAVLKEGFENRWIDVYENEGKRSGAYSSGAAVHPFVLLNYNGTLRSQFTLAHEMGHALHSYFSYKHQNPVDSNYVIFVAEVASTCNEALLMQHLLGKTTDKKERAFLINHFMEQFKGTVYRQTMFAEFEMNIGRMVQEGKTLTPDVLSSEYKRLNELYYGPDMIIDDDIAMEWARIPHFYYNYYVFQYATGFSAAMALSRKILNEGESAVQDYLNFLSGGCSKSPIDLLKGAGVDMTDPAPVNEALKLFGELLDEMEELMKE